MVLHGRQPDDLASASKLICLMPHGVLSELCMNVLMFIQYKKSEVQISRIHQLLQVQDIHMTSADIQKVANAICYHYRCAVTGSLSAEEFIANIQACMLYPDDKIEVIAEAWRLEGRFLLQKEIKEHLSIGELLSIDWKLSMAVSSSACKNLNAPVVTMLTRVLNPNGDISSKAFEMTLDQFQEFSKQLEQTKSVLETV